MLHRHKVLNVTSPRSPSSTQVALLITGHLRRACENDRPLKKHLADCQNASHHMRCNVIMVPYTQIDGSAFMNSNCSTLSSCNLIHSIDARTCAERLGQTLHARRIIMRQPLPLRTRTLYPESTSTLSGYEQMIDGIALAASKATTDDVLVRLRFDIANSFGLGKKEFQGLETLSRGVLRVFGALPLKPRYGRSGVTRADNCFAARRNTFLAFVRAWNATIWQCADAPRNVTEVLDPMTWAFKSQHIPAKADCLPARFHSHVEWSVFAASERVGIRVESFTPGKLLWRSSNQANDRQHAAVVEQASLRREWDV